LTEFKEVIVEFALLNVHYIVLDLHEFFNRLVELTKDLKNRGSHGFTLGVTNFDLLQLVELLDSASQVHNVLASFAESIKSYK
jgi:hypothetical protein